MTAYEVVGEGFPYLVLPGFGCGRWMFREMAKRLADHASFVLVDSRGMGDAPRADGAYALEDLAKDGLNLMEALGHRSFGVIGISMGGMTALEVVRLAPSKVSCLIMLCSLAPGSESIPPPIFSEEDIYRIYGGLDRKGVEELVSASAHKDFAVNQKDRFRKFVEMRMQQLPDPGQLIYQTNAVNDYLQGSLDLKTIKCPTLVLSGEDDVFVRPENSRHLANTIPNAQLALFPRSSHLFFFEKEADVAESILTFMESACAFH